MKSFLFLSKILAGCAFFSNYHARNNLSFLGSTNVIAIKKMVSCKKFPTFGLKFSDGQKKSVESSEKAIDAVGVEMAPKTFFETFRSTFFQPFMSYATRFADFIFFLNWAVIMPIELVVNLSKFSR